MNPNSLAHMQKIPCLQMPGEFALKYIANHLEETCNHSNL